MRGTVIAPADARDADAVIALWHAAGLTRPWNDPLADFALALATPTAAILLARDGEVPIGSVMVGHDGHRGWIYYLAVTADRRGQGVGRALMDAATARLRAAGIPKVQLMVRAGNDAAHGFYRALGFDQQDVVVLGRRLDD